MRLFIPLPIIPLPIIPLPNPLLIRLPNPMRSRHPIRIRTYTGTTLLPPPLPLLLVLLVLPPPLVVMPIRLPRAPCHQAVHVRARAGARVGVGFASRARGIRWWRG